MLEQQQALPAGTPSLKDGSTFGSAGGQAGSLCLIELTCLNWSTLTVEPDFCNSFKLKTFTPTSLLPGQQASVMQQQLQQQQQQPPPDTNMISDQEARDKVNSKKSLFEACARNGWYLPPF